MWSPVDDTVQVPFKKNADDSGYDIRAWKFIKAMTSDLSGSGEVEVLPDENGLLPGISSTPDTVTLNPGERVMISSGYCAVVHVPDGLLPSWVRFDISICSRSGTPFNEGLAVANQPGTVDVGYRGHIIASIVNMGRTARTIRLGDRVAQLVVRPVILPVLEKAVKLPEAGSSRGSSGFGDSGKK